MSDAFLPHPLPRGWTVVPVSQAGHVQLGRQRSPRHHRGRHIRPYLRVANVFEGRIDTSDVMEMNFEPHEYETYRLHAEDILLNEGQSLDLVGRPAMYRDELPGACFTNSLVRFRAGPHVLPAFALLVFRHYLHGGVFQKIARWTTNIAHLGAGRFGDLPFPVPPEAEQRRIVAAVEQHLSDIDSGVAALERVRANLRRYRASVLKAACEGRLVPTEAELSRREKRTYEPANLLVDRILHERSARWERAQLARMAARGETPRDDRWKSKYVQPAPPALVDLPSAPEGWSWARLGAVADVQLGQQRAPVHASAEVTYAYIRAANITWRGLDLSDVKTMGFPDPARYRLEPGDVLLSEASGSPGEVGKPAIWRGEVENCCYQKTLLRVRPYSDELLPEWLHLNFLATAMLGRFAKLAPGVGILHLTAERMLEWPLPIPTTHEQRRILAEVDRLLSIADEAEQAVQAQLSRAGRLRQSVLKTAFEGKLVPQDLSDEPASVLVERLRRTEAGEPTPAARARPRRAGASPDRAPDA